jgi:hypothetical protein
MDKDMLEELISGRKLLQKILDKPNNLGLELANF